MYRDYYGAAGCGPLQPLEKHRWPYKELVHLDEALLWAGCVADRGTAVLAIDGDDGTQLNQSEIAVGILCRREVPDRPTVTKVHALFRDGETR